MGLGLVFRVSDTQRHNAVVPLCVLHGPYDGSSLRHYFIPLYLGLHC